MCVDRTLSLPEGQVPLRIANFNLQTIRQPANKIIGSIVKTDSTAASASEEVPCRTAGELTRAEIENKFDLSSHVTKNERERISELMRMYAGAFFWSYLDLGPCDESDLLSKTESKAIAYRMA